MEHSYRLVVSCNKKYPLLNTPGTVYVEAGRKVRLEKSAHTENEDSEFLDSLPFGDDTGDNISLKNPEWNEMTVIYWVFRNYEKLGNPEYIGFEQYRRHFIFGEWRKVTERALCFPFDEVNEAYEKVLRQDRENVERYLSKYDLIYPKYHMSCSVYEQYRRESPNGHHIEDLDLVVRIISELFPSYKAYAGKYLGGRMNCFCNMFVMKKELFFEFCNFIFPVLFEFEKRRNNADRSFAEKRLFVSERLTGIFICRLVSEHYRCCPVPVALVSHHDKAEILPSSASKGSENAVVIRAFCNGAAAAAACLASIGENIKRGRGTDVPDVLVQSEALSAAEQKLLSETADRFGLRVSFPDISILNKASGSCTKIRSHYDSLKEPQSPGVPALCLISALKNYRKIAFIDSRCTVLGDLIELLRSSAESGFAAVPSSLRFYLASKAEALASGKPHKVLAECADFFSAPLVVLNTEKTESSGAAEWLTSAVDGCFRNGSFDKVAFNNIKEKFKEKFFSQTEALPCSWNIEPELMSQNGENKLLPDDAASLVREAHGSPKLINFSNDSVKPWIGVVYDEDLIWWEYFRKCPGYDILLQNLRSGRYDSAGVQGSADLSSVRNSSERRPGKFCSAAALIRRVISLFSR